MNKKPKAIALLSGGLDSIIAARLIKEQDIEVICIYFSSPFWSSEEKERELIKKITEENCLDLKIINLGDDYLEIIKNPEYGYGKGMNPCVDCKIFMLKKAKEIMENLNASFIITGEVIGQRPMSQHKSALNYIEKRAEVRGILIRPLSGKILPPTNAEIAGLINREKLLDISGRSRKQQNMLASKLGITKFSSPAGGCLLTQKVYSKKLRDLFEYSNNVTMKDILLLNYGRHFRFKNSKIIVGRNSKENDILKKEKSNNSLVLEIADNIPSPVTILSGNKDKEAIDFAAQLTILYSDANKSRAKVQITDQKDCYYIDVELKITKESCFSYNLSNV